MAVCCKIRGFRLIWKSGLCSNFNWRFAETLCCVGEFYSLFWWVLTLAPYFCLFMNWKCGRVFLINISQKKTICIYVLCLYLPIRKQISSYQLQYAVLKKSENIVYSSFVRKFNFHSTRCWCIWQDHVTWYCISHTNWYCTLKNWEKMKIICLLICRSV